MPFGGRQSELKFLNEWLESDDRFNNLLITAPAGRGKTALLIRWIDSLQSDWPVAFVPISIRYETNRAPVFYQALAARLANILNQPLPATPPSDPAIFYKDKVIEYIDEFAASGQRCLVVIDGLDEASGWSVNTTVLPASPPAGLKVVASARLLAGDSGEGDWLSRLGWTDAADTLSVQPLNRQGIADVLNAMAVPLDRLARNVDIISELHRLTEQGDPLLLNLYVEDLLKKGEAAAHLEPEDLVKLKPGFGAYFDRWFDQQEEAWTSSRQAVDSDLVNVILAALACALGPLRLHVLDALLGRIYRGTHVVTSQSIRPLRRFVIGDEENTGYVLAHPKLADYIRRERFAGARVIAQTQAAFIDWCRKVVLDLNAGRRNPETANEYSYALLHYTQHLTEHGGEDKTLLFRELVEDGWRSAWEALEGGYEGFSRDVELAWTSMRQAAEADPDVLKEAKIGLGGQIRCMLCMSSMRSIGVGISAELLADLVTNEALTWKQALYLVGLKEDKSRPQALAAVVPQLPAEAMDYALQTAYGIADPKSRTMALLAILPSLQGEPRKQTLRHARRTAQQVTDHRERIGACNAVMEHIAPEERPVYVRQILDDIKSDPQSDQRLFLMESLQHQIQRVYDYSPPEELLQRVVDDIEFEERAVQEEAGEATPPTAGTDDIYDLVDEARRSSLTQEDAEVIIARALKSESGYLATNVVEALEPDMRQQVMGFLVDQLLNECNYATNEVLKRVLPELNAAQVTQLAKSAFSAFEDYYNRSSLRTLLPRLSDEDLSLFIQLCQAKINSQAKAAERLDAFDLARTIEVLGPRLSQSHLEDLLKMVGEVSSRFGRGMLFGAIARFMPSDQIAAQLIALRNGTIDVDVGEALAELAEHLPDNLLGDALDTAKAVTDLSDRARVLTTLIPRLPADLLRQVLKMTRDFSNIEARSSVLVALLPRLREIGQDFALADAYRLAYVIGDRGAAAAAMGAALSSVPVEDRAQIVEPTLGAMADLGAQLDDMDLVLRVVALCILLRAQAVANGDELIEKVVGILRHRESELRAIMLTLLSTTLPKARAQPLIEEVLATGNVREHGILAILTALQPTDELRRLLRGTKQAPDDDLEQRATYLAAALASYDDDRAAVAAYNAGCKEMSKIPESDRIALAGLQTFVSFALTPPLPEDEFARQLVEFEKLLGSDLSQNRDEIVIALLVAGWVLPDEILRRNLNSLTQIGANSPRPATLMFLSFVLGAVRDMFGANPRIGAKQMPDPPLLRLGGRTTVVETVAAVRDVCHWWP